MNSDKNLKKFVFIRRVVTGGSFVVENPFFPEFQLNDILWVCSPFHISVVRVIRGFIF